MSCEAMERALARYVAGELTGEALADLHAHLDGCPSCRALAVAATHRSPDDAAAAGEAIVRGVLARTSGSACGAAESRLHAFVTAELDRVDAELVARHLSTCAPCRELAVILSWAPGACRQVAFMEPPAGFTEAVIRRSAAVRSASVVWRRLRRGWGNALLRPRFPLELGYAGALVAVLLFGTPNAPLRPALEGAARLARANPVELVAAGAGSGGIVSAIVSFSGWTYSQASHRVEATGRVASETSSHMGVLFDAALAGDIGTVNVQLKKVGGDLERLLHAIGSGVAGASSHTHERTTDDR